MPNRYWIGLDVSEGSTNICAVDQGGAIVLQTACETSAKPVANQMKVLKKRQVAAVAMETGATHSLPRQLQRLGFPVVMLDAGKVSKFLSIRHHKTDENDAHSLAEAVRIGAADRLQAYIKGPECQAIRDQLILRDQLLRQRSLSKNALRSALRKHGSEIRRFSSGKGFRTQVESELKSIGRLAGRAVADRYRPLLDLAEAQDRYLAQMDADIAALVSANDATKRFMQVPGVGPICAASFYSIIEDPHRFAKAENVGAYLGMVPRLKQSGTATRRSGISKAGDALTRSHLAMAAGVLLSHAAGESALREWGRGLAARIGYGRARVAVARKMAVVLLSMWKSGSDFQAYPAK